jgi:hypothetical protein
MWIESLRQKSNPERNNDTNQNSLNLIMHDTIHQYMNRFEIARHMTEGSSDTIQNNLNRIKIIETDFFKIKDHFNVCILNQTHGASWHKGRHYNIIKWHLINTITYQRLQTKMDSNQTSSKQGPKATWLHIFF